MVLLYECTVRLWIKNLPPLLFPPFPLPSPPPRRSADAVCKSVGIKIAGTLEHSQWIPDWLVRGVAAGAVSGSFKSGIVVDLGQVGGVVATDGLSSIQKVSKFNGNVVLIYGTRDEIMPSTFADDFEAACASTTGKFTKVTVVDGQHHCEQFSSPVQCTSIAKGLKL